ncbi:AAA family ATPase [Mucilaginibacter terrae]|uniref:AAA family ATPase n=1 Tax=Mucilaginibacter terrae TaxID=1955052 RepID=UPI003626B093
MKIHIMGASCAGSTTLGNALAEQLNYLYFDTDHFFWEQTDPPFTVKRDREKRIEMLKEAIASHQNYIVGGSLVSWGDEWFLAFDLVIFLYVPPQIRIERLKRREFERYGDVIYTKPNRIQAYHKFLNWATAYDTNAITGRTLQVHEEWLSKVACPILEIRGDTTVQQRIDLILNKINTFNLHQ